MNSLAAEHIPELLPLYKEAARLLKPNGYFVLLSIHPHFELRGIPTHFDDQDTGESISISTHVHLLSDFTKAGFATNLRLTEIDEYVVSDEWVSRSPGMSKHQGHPITFVGVWQK